MKFKPPYATLAVTSQIVDHKGEKPMKRLFIIIPVEDLEAVRKQLEDNQPNDWLEKVKVEGELSAYDKILTYYKKVDLDKEIREGIAFDQAKKVPHLDDMQKIGHYVQGYKQAIKDIIGK